MVHSGILFGMKKEWKRNDKEFQFSYKMEKKVKKAKGFVLVKKNRFLKKKIKKKKGKLPWGRGAFQKNLKKFVQKNKKKNDKKTKRKKMGFYHFPYRPYHSFFIPFFW